MAMFCENAQDTKILTLISAITKTANAIAMFERRFLLDPDLVDGGFHSSWDEAIDEWWLLADMAEQFLNEQVIETEASIHLRSRRGHMLDMPAGSVLLM